MPQMTPITIPAKQKKLHIAMLTRYLLMFPLSPKVSNMFRSAVDWDSLHARACRLSLEYLQYDHNIFCKHAMLCMQVSFVAICTCLRILYLPFII